MSRHARAGRMEMHAPSVSGALEWAAMMAQIQRKLDARTWEEVLEEAQANSRDAEYRTLAAWDAASDAYLGDCTKGCYQPEIMTKGSIREFDAFGVYICSGCDYAYPPGCEPERVELDTGIDILAHVRRAHGLS